MLALRYKRPIIQLLAGSGNVAGNDLFGSFK
jgi:hypothetical protein